MGRATAAAGGAEAAAPPGAPVGWTAVVPLKPLAGAKSRLAGALAGVEHRRLVLALAADTVGAARATPAVRRVLVVTDDPLAAVALTTAGATVIADLPGAGLNAALRYGAAHARRLAATDGVAALAADLAALRPAELADALAAASRHRRAFVADAAGTGTTLLTARPAVELRPAFGPGSRAAHHHSGAVDLAGRWPSVRTDVDTVADLAGARGLGLGRHTAALLGAGHGSGTA